MKLISVHIPRTGGSTLKAYLTSAFGEQKFSNYFLPAWNPGSELYQLVREWNQNTFQIYAPSRKAEFIHEHLPVWVYDGYFEQAPRICFMRDPATWVISCFFYAKALKHIPRTMGIFEYMEITYRRNWQSWFMDESIKNFDFIGFFETYQEDVEHLFSFIGMELPTLQTPANVSTDPVYLKVKAELLKDRMFLRTVRKLFKEDYKLYKEGWKKWKNSTPLKIIS